MKIRHTNMSTAKNKTIRTFNKRSKNYDRTIEGRLAGWSKLLLLEHIVINDNDNILDIGCGTGKLLALLSEKGKANCFGIDITKGMIEAAKKNNPNMTFQISDCVRACLKTHYDCAISTKSWKKPEKRSSKNKTKVYHNASQCLGIA